MIPKNVFFSTKRSENQNEELPPRGEARAIHAVLLYTERRTMVEKSRVFANEGKEGC